MDKNEGVKRIGLLAYHFEVVFHRWVFLRKKKTQLRSRESEKQIKLNEKYSCIDMKTKILARKLLH